MKLDDLIEIAKKGQLTLQKREMGQRTRLKWLWDAKGEHITGSKQVPYELHSYHARCEWQAENEFYRITKKDYAILQKIVSGI